MIGQTASRGTRLRETLIPRVDVARSVDGVLARFYAVTFLFTIAQALGVPLVPPFLELSYGVSVAYVGAVMGIYGLMQIVLRLPMGDMADRRGRKPSILMAFGFTLAAAVVLTFAQAAWWAIPGVAFFGFAGGIFWVAANSYLFDRVPKERLARVTTDYSVAVGASFLVGPPVGHVVADHFGFRAAFALFLATSVVGLLVAFTLPEAKQPPKPRNPVSPYARAWGLLKHPALLVSAAGTLLYSMLFNTMTAFFELHVLAAGFGVTLAGLLLGGRQASALVIRIGLPRLLDRVGPTRVLMFGVVVAGIATMLLPMATTLVGLSLVVAASGAATGMMIPANLMLVHEGAPTEQRGLANGIYGTMLGLGGAIAPPLFGSVGEAFGLAWTFHSAGATCILLALLVMLFRARVADARKA